MPDVRRFLTADERLRELQRDHKMLRRERMIREVAGPVWNRMVRVTPLSFQGQGRLVARVLLASREAVIEALVEGSRASGAPENVVCLAFQR